MAAVTVDSQHRTIFGNRRAILAQIDIAADADTWATGLTSIAYFHAVSSTNNAIGGTVSGGTITFQTAGEELNTLVMVIGT